MGRKQVVCLAGLCLAASARGAQFGGRLELRDASNADRPVGATVETGIPQDHALKVVINEARIGRRRAANAPVVASVRDGGKVVATAEGVLDKTGSGAVLVPIGAEWEGQHHLLVEILRRAGDDDDDDDDDGDDADDDDEDEDDDGHGHGHGHGRVVGRLQGEFRVIEGEPSPEVPFAVPAILTVLAAVTMVIWWTRRSPLTA